MPDSSRFAYKTSADVLVLKGNMVLMGRRKNTGFGDGMYGIPGGHLEQGETLRMTAVREAREEAGIEIDPNHLEFAHVLHNNSSSVYIQFFFISREWKGTPFINEPESCDSLEWFALTDLPKNTVPHIRHVITQILHHNNYSEFGWNQ